MKTALLTLYAAIFLSSSGCGGHKTANDSNLMFLGCCDASTAVALDNARFVVANDEDNAIRVYNRHEPGLPVQVFDFSRFLGLKKKDESDLEGSARIGDTIYWITSHGRNKDGEDRPARRRFFATQLLLSENSIGLQPLGSARSNLLEVILADNRFDAFNLDEAVAKAPKEQDALNIEGMTSTESGSLLIGFRNPIPQGRAIMFELKNPGAYVTGEPPEIGDPWTVDFGGLGIRSLSRHHSDYFAIAGSYNGGDAFKLYHWTIGSQQPEWLSQIAIQGLNPEGIAFPSGSGPMEYFLISDDGTRKLGGKDCKSYKDPSIQRFRGRNVQFDVSNGRLPN